LCCKYQLRTATGNIGLNVLAAMIFRAIVARKNEKPGMAGFSILGIFCRRP